MIRIASSDQAPRSANGAPRSSISSRIQPTPAPRMTRPPERWSSVASALAASTGWRWGRTSTVVPSFARSVTPATMASAVSGSRKVASGASGNCPVSLYG